MTASEGEKPYGGEKLGDYFVQVDSDEVKVIANFDFNASKHTALEAWLVDFGGNQTIYLGTFDEDMKLTKTIQISEWIYEAIIMIEQDEKS